MELHEGTCASSFRINFLHRESTYLYDFARWAGAAGAAGAAAGAAGAAATGAGAAAAGAAVAPASPPPYGMAEEEPPAGFLPKGLKMGGK